MTGSINKRVAVIGMGCTKFGERWEVGSEELMVEAFEEAIKDAGLDRSEIQAAWLGTCLEEVSVGKSALRPDAFEARQMQKSKGDLARRLRSDKGEVPRTM